MKVSLNWLKELVEFDLSVEQLAHTLTMAGLEVEDISPVAGKFDRVVVAEVAAVSPHPNADKLRVTEVNVGSEARLQIVCGAPNVAVGMRVPCALVGASLPGIQIKAAKLRGVDSNGMLCSARELGLSEDHGGLLALPLDAPIGANIREYLDLDDVVITLKVTPNRGDCLSMLGIARDLAAMLGKQLKVADPSGFSGKTARKAPPVNEFRTVELLAGELCPRYCGRVINGLMAAANTPAWMQRRLERAGFRPISPLVDITNYVNLAVGQPMHAFDNHKLVGKIGVRLSQPGESLELLNDQQVALAAGSLLIVDDSGPIALAGVMGGKSTMVTDATTSVFFESAHFAPDAVKGRARALGINSDAAFRFERGVDPALCEAALELATQLALEICATDSTAVGSVTHAEQSSGHLARISLRANRVSALIGMPVSEAEIVRTLSALNCRLEASEGEGSWTVAPPSYRFDLRIEEDLIEEIARAIGYENVPSIAPTSSVPMLHLSEEQRGKWSLRRQLAGMGYQEVINYSFVAEEWERDFCANDTPVRVANPIASHMAVMRTSLIAGLCHTLVGQVNRGETRAKLCEQGRVFLSSEATVDSQPEHLAGLAWGATADEQWGIPADARVDFFSVKGELEVLLSDLILEFVPIQHVALHPGRAASIRLRSASGEIQLGMIGELHPKLTQALKLGNAPIVFELDASALHRGRPLRYVPISRMPSVRRDLAILVDEKFSAGAILEALYAAKPPVVTEIALFDLYRSQHLDSGRKSLAFRVVMQDTERTLTDVESDTIVGNLVEVISQKFGATLRK